MAKYEVVVMETQRYTIVVDADSKQEAMDKVAPRETDEMDRDYEFYDAEVVDAREVCQDSRGNVWEVKNG